MKYWIYIIAMTMSTLAHAQNDGLILHYDFEGATGTNVPDKSGSGIDATLCNEASIIVFGSHHALSLGNGTGYLDMGSQAGSQFKSCNNFTISTYYYVEDDYTIDGNGYFLWTFATSAACTQSEGKYHYYRLNLQKCGTSTGGWGNEIGCSRDMVTSKGRWIHVVYQMNNGEESLFVDGVKVGSATGIPLNTNNFGSATVNCCWLGRACFSDDAYLQNTLITDFRLYNRVLNHNEIMTLASQCSQLNADYTQSASTLAFDFSKAESNHVTDAIGGSITATAMNNAMIADMGTYKVLNLGNGNGYLDMTAAAGNVFKSSDDFTISTYYCVDDNTDITGAGNFLWAFATQTACDQTNGKYHAYRINAQKCCTTTGGWGSEEGFARNAASDKGRWIHVAYSVKGGTEHLYVDGTEVGSATNIPANSTNFGTISVPYCWLGRACFANDDYLRNTLIYDFRIYNRALSASEIRQIGNEREALDYQYLHGSNGDKTSLNATITSVESFLNGINATDYPSGAIDDLNDLLAYAKGISASDNASQVLVDRTNSQLNDAWNDLQGKQGTTFTLPTNGTSNNMNRGFIHPGGLHTQADFDRVKAQLAAGNAKVTEAYNNLIAGEYAQPTVVSWPVETIVRGGTSGQNYINAARAATMAYQNGLRWKIEDNASCAANAVNILMAWARTTKLVTGDSNWALATGLYGYQFAQAAELVRDYPGWSQADFETFKTWMLNVWYQPALHFLRGRNGTWENPGKWWRAPGHYWSNWGLCNALCVASIGLLCDDVYIYNQGMSFFKYDQVGTFTNPRTGDPIWSDGLTDFLGNFVVTTSESELETGAYGQLGQMNESGRDGGHAAMALGLAIDIAKTGWNQGDDLFSYMDHRLAAGIEFLAGQALSISDMPWTNYLYINNAYAYTDSRSWLMTGYATGAETRRYWGNVIGVYEGVKGVRMPMSEQVYANMGIDGSAWGGVSGPYDHLGFTVLMNTHDPQLAPASQVPTELTPKMTYNKVLSGSLIPSYDMEKSQGNVSSSNRVTYHSELGGLVNNYWSSGSTAVPNGGSLRLEAVLPVGETDTGLWRWDTGETTNYILVNTDESRVYRVHYTNANGVESQQCFTIAAQGDCLFTNATQTIYSEDTYLGTNEATLDYGASATLTVSPENWEGSFQWSNGETNNSITISRVTSERDVYCIFTNYGGRQCLYTFHLSVNADDMETLVLNESCGSYTPEPKNHGTVKLYADLNARWQTICLPFGLNHNQIEETFGTGTVVAKLNTVNGTMLNFLQVPTIQAHHPYLLIPGNAATLFTIHDVTVSQATEEALTQQVGDIRFIGTYADISDGVGLYGIKNGHLSEVSSSSPVLPFHAYFDFSGSSHAKQYVIALNEMVTGIRDVEKIGNNDSLAHERLYYDISGSLVATGETQAKTLKPGLYILRQGQNIQKILIP